MNSHKLQKQHRISKVYLKEFGYQKANIWYISVWEKGKEHTDNLLIDKFTVETNIFDLPFEEENIKRHFENTSQKIETLYKTVLSSLKKQKQLIPKHKDILCHYTANLFCRSKPTRDLFQNLLDSKDKRNSFLQEITMFVPEQLADLKEGVSIVPSEHRLNLVIGTIMNYLVTVLRSFSCIVLEAIPDKGWFTSDNPVIIDPQEETIGVSDYLYIIPIDSEIYLPLSPDYCLFLFHENSSQKMNSLRYLSLNKISKADEPTHDNICKMIALNSHQYFIFNQEIEMTYLNEI